MEFDDKPVDGVAGRIINTKTGAHINVYENQSTYAFDVYVQKHKDADALALTGGMDSSSEGLFMRLGLHP